MPTPLFHIDPLIPAIESGATILTPNNRLANKIQQAWGIHQKEQGSTVWHWPNVYAIEHWIDSLWQQLQDSGWPEAGVVTIDPFQELLLWEHVIDEDGDKPPLLNPGGLAANAQHAWQLLQQWRIPLDELATYPEPSAAWMQRWGVALQQKIQALNGISRVDRIPQLCHALECGALPKVEQVILVDFQTRPPLYDTLLRAATGNCQSLIAPELSSSCCWQVAVTDNQQELTSAALWARQILQEAPNSRIGIIIPDLAQQRQRVERIFREHLDPDHLLPSVERATAPFNISTATPLAETPLIDTALRLLQLNRYRLPLEHYCQLLQRPFWGNLNDLADRALAESRLRARAKPTLQAIEFREVCAKTSTQPEGNPFSNRLEQFETLRRQSEKKAGYRYWRQLFERQLAALGWPGGRTLDSVEYQQQQHWQQVLDRFSNLDVLAFAAPDATVSLEKALSNLQRLAQNTPFQAESEDSPLQILGLLEGAGLRFTHLWMAGMDDRQWPPPPSPNSLLPLALQRKHQMPRASADRELELARDLLATYRSRADQIVFSHCQFDGESELAPSALIADISVESIDRLLGTDDNRSPADLQIAQRPKLQIVAIGSGPALDLPRDAKSGKPKAITGGSAVLRDQANCPFNAFARWRLGAQQPLEPSDGLTPLERGILLHDCLDQLWGELIHSAALVGLDGAITQSLISSIVEKNLRHWRLRKSELGERFLQLENERLTKLLSNWLDVERTRPDFEVIARESVLDGEFAGLPLSLRIDRIDRTPAGQRLLIDYKTGSPTINGWLGERPYEPQLPLYALMQEHPSNAIGFAIINAEQQCLTGLADNAELLPTPASGHDHTPSEWLTLLEHWRVALTTLANEYHSGNAALCVYNKQAFTQQRELLPLNRWLEREQIERYLAQPSPESQR